MNIEQFGIGLLCVSQVGMWVRNVQVLRKAWRKQDAFEKAHLTKLDQFLASGDAFQREAFIELQKSTQQQIGWLEGISNDLALALQRMPKKRNLRKPKAPPPEASKDSIGSVSS